MVSLKLWRIVRWILGIFLGVLLLGLVTLAIPVQSWRSGRIAVSPLELIQGGPIVPVPNRVWIDTDAACGASPTADPDDCFAVLMVASAPNVDVVGISTIFGNASLDVTDNITRDLVGRIEKEGHSPIPVFRGASAPRAAVQSNSPSLASLALQKALSEGPLTVLAIGPLTNVTVALEDRPDLQINLVRLVVVMGRRPGHIFHPSENSAHGMLFGHGPVFRDLNFDKDPPAADTVLSMGLPMTLVPYDASLFVTLNHSSFDQMGSGETMKWLVNKSSGWLAFWQNEVGLDGFHPFDLLAAAYILKPRDFNCAATGAWTAQDHSLWSDWFYSPKALLVGPDEATKLNEAGKFSPVIYCPDVSSRLQGWIIDFFHGG